MGNVVTYKGKTIQLDEDPRTGVCNLCRAVIGEVNAQRGRTYQRGHHMHHEAYDDNDPLRYTIEYCPACHRAIENQKGFARFGALHKNEKRSKSIRVSQWTYDKLGEFGSSKNDFDDVIFSLIDFWEKHHKGK